MKPVNQGGPTFHIYLRYRDLFPNATDVEGQYWHALRRPTVLNALGVLGNVNRNFVEGRAYDLNVHHQLNQSLLSAELKAMVNQRQAAFAQPASFVVFTRVGCLQLMRNLIVYGNKSAVLADQKEEQLGELVLLGNTYIEFDLAGDPSEQSTLDVLLLNLPRWDVDNQRDLANSVVRIFTILTDILPGQDPKVVKLTSQLGIDFSDIKIDGLSLDDFISTVYGVYAHGREMTQQNTAQFDIRNIFSRVALPKSLLWKLVRGRARSISQFKQLLSLGRPCTRSSFLIDVRKRSFLAEGLNSFRKFPMLKVDRYRVIMLDLQFIVELLTAGVYWSIFDDLAPNKREGFRELWGRLYEVYAVDLLVEFYPPMSGLLTPDIEHSEGQIDALLDFGSAVLVFEMKASLLTEAAKRGRSKADFIQDFNRKFVRNEKGKPKVILQLATSCKAIEDGRLKTSCRSGNRPGSPRIYPIFVSDEPAVEALFFNTYLNELFQTEIQASAAIRPVTAMSIDELEEVLPYVAANIFTWEELLQQRFLQTEVSGYSVHQTIFDLLIKKKTPPLRNEPMLKKSAEILERIAARFKPVSA
jgi:hypothetical protein